MQTKTLAMRLNTDDRSQLEELSDLLQLSWSKTISLLVHEADSAMKNIEARCDLEISQGFENRAGMGL